MVKNKLKKDIKPKKKICPKCKGKVYNATQVCKLNYNNTVCNFKFISKRNLKDNFLNNSILNDIILLNKIFNNYNFNFIFPYRVKKITNIK